MLCDMSVGDTVRRLRKANGWTQSVLAEKAGISRSAVAAIDGEAFSCTGRKLGVALKAVDKTEAAAFGFDDAGLAVVSVSKDGPADLAGMKDGDLVVAVNGRRVLSSAEYLEAVKNAETDAIAVVVSRHGERLILQVFAQ